MGKKWLKCLFHSVLFAIPTGHSVEMNRLTSEQLVKQRGHQRGAKSSSTLTRKKEVSPSIALFINVLTASLLASSVHNSESPACFYPHKHTHVHTAHLQLSVLKHFLFYDRGHDWPGNITPLPHNKSNTHNKFIHSLTRVSSRWCVCVHTFWGKIHPHNVTFLHTTAPFRLD